VPLRRTHSNCSGRERIAGAALPNFNLNIFPVLDLKLHVGLARKFGWVSRCGPFCAPGPANSGRGTTQWGLPMVAAQNVVRSEDRDLLVD